MEKEQKQELGWRVSVLPIPAFHHYVLHVQSVQWNAGMGRRVSVLPIPAFHHYVLHVQSVQWNAGMGNTDTLHPNSCFCSFSIPTSEIF